MEPNHGSGNDKPLEINPEAKRNHSDPTKVGTLSGVKLYPEAKQHGNEPATESSTIGSELIPESKHDGSGPNVEVSRFSHSSSSSSRSDDEEDPFDDSFDKADQDEPQSPRSVSVSSPDVCTQTPQWSMVSVSPRGGSGNLSSTEVLPRTPEWIMFNSSPMKSPPIQTMGKPTGYDPNRVPSSIFSTKPTTPMDWSVASNESLFSIHMGNNSFSRDNIILQGLDFPKPEEWNNPPLNPNNASETKSKELNNFTPNLPPVVEASEKGKEKGRVNIYVREGLDEEELHETPKMFSGEKAEDHCKQKLAPDSQGVRLSTTSSILSDGRGVTRTSGSDPRVSNESTQSSDSFAFPVLLTDAGKSGSSKVISESLETPHSQPQDLKSTPKVAESNWFSCFTCLPRFC